MKSRRTLLSASLLSLVAASTSGAQTVTFYESRDVFLAALAGAAVQTQDFSGIPAGTSLTGVAVVPGLVAQSSFPRLEVFLSGGDRAMFGIGRELSGGSYYEFVNVGGYTALGFDIQSWDPRTSGASLLLTFASGATITRPLTATNATEGDPVFVGMITSVPFATLRLFEPAEVGGGINEEVAIDDLVAATTVPEPSTVALVASGLVVMGLRARRRRADA